MGFLFHGCGFFLFACLVLELTHSLASYAGWKDQDNFCQLGNVCSQSQMQ